MDLTVHVDHITLSGDYDGVMPMIQALKLESQVQIGGELRKIADQPRLLGSTIMRTTTGLKSYASKVIDMFVQRELLHVGC